MGVRRLTVKLGIGFLLAALAMGCAGAPDIVSREPEAGERYSAEEVRRMSVDQPFLMSGDFFRERNRDRDEMIRPGELIDSVRSPASAPADKGAEPLPSTASAIKMALVFDPSSIGETVIGAAVSAVPVIERDLPVIVADPGRVRDMLASAGCLERRDLGCVSSSLGRYPGARMVILVEGFETTDTGSARLTVSVVDTGLGHRYPPMAIEAPAPSADDRNALVRGGLIRAVAFAVERSTGMPWYCRAFGQEGEQWYVTAGERSGLTPGDRLVVVSPGRVVKSPAGAPAGWIPGEPKGTLQVDALFGDDFSACTLTDGSAPAAEDLLMRRAPTR